MLFYLKNSTLSEKLYRNGLFSFENKESSDYRRKKCKRAYRRYYGCRDDFGVVHVTGCSAVYIRVCRLRTSEALSKKVCRVRDGVGNAVFESRKIRAAAEGDNVSAVGIFKVNKRRVIFGYVYAVCTGICGKGNSRYRMRSY